jgi:murein DD-endopeptidase MepM/ murein hydrolase activator NlpD
MEKNRYRTLLIMPSTPEKRIIKVSLPSYLWRSFCVIVAAILCWAGIGTWSICKHVNLTQRSHWLERECELAKTELRDQAQKVQFLDNELKRIRGQAVFIQNYLGLNSQGVAKGRIGQGGVEVSSEASSLSSSLPYGVKPSSPKLPETEPGSCLSRHDVARLRTDLYQIISTLQDRQKELEQTPAISPVDPLKSWISSSYGMRISPFTGKKQFHPGIDLAGWKGTPIMASASGKVLAVKKKGSLGLIVKIRHSPVFATVYGHLLKAAVKRGQHVKRGEIIGYMGNSGRSTGYHLHYAVIKNGKHVNPSRYILDRNNTSSLFAAK